MEIIDDEYWWKLPDVRIKFFKHDFLKAEAEVLAPQIIKEREVSLYSNGHLLVEIGRESFFVFVDVYHFDPNIGWPVWVGISLPSNKSCTGTIRTGDCEKIHEFKLLGYRYPG